MRILIPVIGFGAAGGYRVLSELANHWTDSGNHVDFLVDCRMGPPYFPTNAAVRRFDRKGRLLEDREENLEPEFSASGNAVSIYLGMWRALQKIGSDYDVILANHSLTTFPVFLANISSAKRFYYVQAYEPEYYELERGIKAKILKAVATISYKLPLLQIANSPIYIDYRSVQARHWIPPGLDLDVFHRRSSPPSFESTRPTTIGVIGRREPAKGTEFALQAFEKLAAEDSHVRLKVAYGNLPAGWSHEHAEIVVPKDDRELAEFYRSVDILLAPGQVQLGCFHYPVLEGMACGTPVVTTGYSPSDKNNAWLVPVKDSDGMVDAVREIQSSSAKELVSKLDNGHAAIAEFDWRIVAQRFIEIMEN